MPGTSSGGTASPFPGAPTPQAPPVVQEGPGIVMEAGAVVINAVDPLQAMGAYERKLDDIEFRRSGSRGRGGRYAYGGG